MRGDRTVRYDDEDDDSTHVKVVIPRNALDPIEVVDGIGALRFAVVERAGVGRLGAEWNAPGNYVLLDPVAPDGTWSAYVGKASPGSVLARLRIHLRKRDEWRRALVIVRDTRDGWSSAEVGWLEGRLYDLLAASGRVTLSNGNRPNDETLPPRERRALEASVLPVTQVLRLLGYALDGPPVTTTRPPSPIPTTPTSNSTDEVYLPPPPDRIASTPVPATETLTAEARPIRTTRSSRRSPRHLNVSLRELVEVGLVAPDAVLSSVNGVHPGEATVTADGSVLLAGETHPNLSRAAQALSKRSAVNGWAFWGVPEEDGSKTTLSSLRDRFLVNRSTTE